MRGPQYGWFSGIIADGFFDGSTTFAAGPGQRRVEKSRSVGAHRAVFDLHAHRSGGGRLDRHRGGTDREVTALPRRREAGARARFRREPTRRRASRIAGRSASPKARRERGARRDRLRHRRGPPTPLSPPPPAPLRPRPPPLQPGWGGAPDAAPHTFPPA